MAYETFAFIYDEAMGETFYQQWLAFPKRHLQEDTKNTLELACDIGALAATSAKDGYKATGLDLSEEMLTTASQRAYEEDVSIQSVEGNMLDLSEIRQHQAITCFSDSLCYMKDRQEVQQAFDEVYQALEENGRFLSDVHSTCQADEVLPECNYHYQGDNFTFLWDSYPGGEKHSIEHFLTFLVEEQEESGRFIREDELHQERIYPLESYLRMLENSGSSKVEALPDFTDEAASEKSKRWFFVTYKDQWFCLFESTRKEQIFNINYISEQHRYYSCSVVFRRRSIVFARIAYTIRVFSPIFALFYSSLLLSYR